MALARWIWGPFVLAGCLGTLPAAQAQPAPQDQVFLERIEFDGSSALDAAALQALAAPFLHRPLRLDDLEELRLRVVRALVEKGHVGSGALYQADAIQGRVLRMTLVDGVVSEVRIRGLARLAPEYVTSRLVREGDVLDLAVLEDRFRLLLADPLFRQIEARVQPVDEQDPARAMGRAVLVLDVQRGPSIQGAVFVHNQQAPAVGSTVAGVEATVRNLSGWGDALVLTLARARGGNNVDAALGLPLLAGRTLLTLHVARSHSSVVEEPVASLDVQSRSQVREVTVSRALIEHTSRRLAFGITASDRGNRTLLSGEPFSFVAGENSGEVRARSLRFAQEVDWRGETAAIAVRSNVVAGRSNLPDPPALADQPRRRYRLWQGQAQWTQRIGGAGGQWTVRMTAQSTPDRLVPVEQFALGGRSTVRGYRENQLVRDRGWFAGLEWQQPWQWGSEPWQRLQVSPFFDAGRGRMVGGAASSLRSVGVALRGQFDRLEVGLQLAHALVERPKPLQRDLQDRGVHFNASWRF